MSIFLGVLISFLLLVICFYMIGLGYGFLFGAPYVPSQKEVIEDMIKIANIREGEVVFDLGCGDGRLLFEAEKHGAKCIGVEITPQLVFAAQIKKILKKSKTKFRIGNMFKQKDLHKADVIFIYTLPGNMNDVYEKIFPKLKIGTRVVANSFSIEGIKPENILSRKKTGHNPIYLYIKR